MFGGNANNGANAGLAYANSNNVPSNANANIGSHLCLDTYYIIDIKLRMASPLGEKYITFERVLVETSVVWTIEGSRIEKQSEL